MSLCKQVWWNKNPRPEEGKVHDLPDEAQVPPNWFRESPEYAAELYALERWYREAKRTPITEWICVVDEKDQFHSFNVKLYTEVTCKVTKV